MKYKFSKFSPFDLNLYQINITEWKDNKKHILSLVDFSNESASSKFETLTYSDYYMDNSYKIRYSKFLMDMLNPYLKEFSDNVYQFQKIFGPWCQKQLSGDYHATHDHGSVGYSAVFYAKMNPDVHQSTNFISPFPSSAGTIETRSFPATEGDLVIFPAHLLHSSVPHRSDEDRIVFSFNLL